ncbi:hypothetical protein F5Y14DRAFT_427786 [Nemania sp. NC0429]|nr:hypothetical protein F5Y14DRAFT_427786 [Nemania sp. NC0429]
MSRSQPACDVNAIPSFDSLPLPKNVAIGALSRRNDTLLAMQKCCSPNTVNSIGDCVLWCEIPDNLTGEQWVDCTQPYIKTAHGVEYRNEGTTVVALRPLALGIAMLALLFSSIQAS